MSNQNLRKIINSPDKKIGMTTNFVARLARVILYDLDIDETTFHMLLNSYVKKENAAKLANAEKSSLKTNLVAFFSKPQMSARNLERFIKVLNPKKVTFQVTFTWKDDTSTSHEVDIDIVDAFGKSKDDDFKDVHTDDED